MSTFTYSKPGIGNVGSYQVSGIPFVTSSIAPVLDTTATILNLPRVTKHVIIKNTNSTEVGLRVSFNNQSVVDNSNYVLLAKGESFSAELKTTDIHLMSDSYTETVSFSVVASMTSIERTEMTQIIPTPPNPLMWIEFSSKINRPILAVNDFFGTVSLSGDGTILAVGGNGVDISGSNNAGSVNIYEEQDSQWIHLQELTASNKEAGALLGYSVSTSYNGTEVLASAVYAKPGGLDYAGTSYMYTKNGSTWSEQILISGDIEQYDEFGTSVSISPDGSTAIVGAPYSDPQTVNNAGSCYVFTKSGSTWSQVQELSSSNASAIFGYATAISENGNTIAVGAKRDLSFNGSVSMYQKVGSTWQRTDLLSPVSLVSGDEFGNSVALSYDGTVLAVGAPSKAVGAFSSAGVVYIYNNIGGSWTEQAITSDDPKASDYFGTYISISSDGTTLAIASYDDFDFSGAVHMYKNLGGTWTKVDKLITSDRETGDNANRISISANGKRLAVGAEREDPNSTSNAGSVYFFNYTRDY